MKSSDNKGGGVVVAVVVVVLAVSIRCILAREYVVGEGECLTAEWGYSLCDYSSWAINKDFNLGDTLVFRFASGEATVAEVTKEDFDACADGVLPKNKKRIYSISPVTLALSTAGPLYLANTIDSCNYQRLAIIVNANATSPSVPTDTPSSSTDPSSSSPPSTPPKGTGTRALEAVLGALGGLLVALLKIWLIMRCVKRRRQRKLLTAAHDDSTSI